VVRLTPASASIDDPQAKALLNSCGSSLRPETTVVCSRFAADSSLEARRRINQLFQLAYDVAFRLGATRCLIGARSNLCGIFERFGFRRFASYIDPVVGSLVAMELDLHDHDHMAFIKSPFLNVYRYLVEEQDGKQAARDRSVNSEYF
jgi:hypothetical protein